MVLDKHHKRCYGAIAFEDPITEQARFVAAAQHRSTKMDLNWDKQMFSAEVPASRRNQSTTDNVEQISVKGNTFFYSTSKLTSTHY